MANKDGIVQRFEHICPSSERIKNKKTKERKNP